ncbi:hypothetical protein AHMF7605_11700 [Adhaeribacter arboris]|uniref:Uncharacterized protein n=1 Tax=Adhaeribacter arboris TaxID=2072846 RepID=A0A2T2YF37_9BACT|nr:hypothetical protein [Adhaeribacter arboris]PSR54136.1 hypothetical protein AHMF7605_11700 [Adhaeribacter arboris]
MRAVQIRDNQTEKDWVNVENMLYLKPSQYVNIPLVNQPERMEPFFDLTKPFTLMVTVVLKNGRLYLKQLQDTANNTVTGWDLEYTGSTLSFNLRNAYGTLSSGRRAWQASIALPNNLAQKILFCNVNTSAYFIVNRKVYPATVGGSGTFTSVAVNTSPIRLGERYNKTEYSDSYYSNLAFFNREITLTESELFFKEIGIVPKFLHPHGIEYWTFNHRSGKKAWDSVELFNYAKPQYIQDPTLDKGLSEFTVTNPGNATIVYDTVANSVTLTQTVSTSAQNQTHLICNSPLTLAGGTYTIELDLENNNTTVQVRIGNVIDLFVGAGTRRKVKLFFSSAARTTNLFFNAGGSGDVGASFTLYGIKVYVTAYGPPLNANHGDLVNFSDAEAALAWVDYYTKSAINRVSNGLEVKTGFPEIQNGLLLDATHTISFPLSGTVINSFKGYAVQAYHVKAGQTLQPGEKITLENNGLYANPSKSIRRKLDAYYLFNLIDSGNKILDLIGSNHATLSGSGFTLTPLNNLR